MPYALSVRHEGFPSLDAFIDFLHFLNRENVDRMSYYD